MGKVRNACKRTSCFFGSDATLASCMKAVCCCTVGNTSSESIVEPEAPQHLYDISYDEEQDDPAGNYVLDPDSESNYIMSAELVRHFLPSFQQS